MQIQRNTAILPIAAAVLLLAGCSRVPFDVKTDKTVVTLSNTYGLTVEKSIDVPNDAIRDDVTYDSVNVNYTIEASEEFASAADVTIYVSKDTSADNSRASGDETIADVSVPPGSSVSGSANSDVLEAVLNDQQGSFVVGGSVEGASLPTGAEINVTVFAEVEGEYRVFP